MSLWRIRHTLSPVVEYALVALVAAYGLFAVYWASLRPFMVATSPPAAAIPVPVPLDAALWTRGDNPAYGYAYAIPPGWRVDDRDPARLRIGRSAKEIGLAGREGEGLSVEVVALPEGVGVEQLASAEFAGGRTALYDVAVDGRPALFAVAFERDRVNRQVVYVPMPPPEPESAMKRALIVRAARTEPAVFSVFLSNVKFYSSDEADL